MRLWKKLKMVYLLPLIHGSNPINQEQIHLPPDLIYKCDKMDILHIYHYSFEFRKGHHEKDGLTY